MSDFIAAFARTIDGDRELKEELLAITQPADFVALAVRRAADRGLILTDAEVWEAFNAGRVFWLATQTP